MKLPHDFDDRAGDTLFPQGGTLMNIMELGAIGELDEVWQSDERSFAPIFQRAEGA